MKIVLRKAVIGAREDDYKRFSKLIHSLPNPLHFPDFVVGNNRT